MDTSLLQLFITALGGGLTVKFVDIAYQEIKSRKQKNVSNELLLDQHIEPLLKVADELVGKLRSLVEGDFKQIAKVDPFGEWEANEEFSGVVFLFGRLWAQIEVMRLRALSGQFSNTERGRTILSFFDCLESRRVRIVSRIIQRAVGEVFLAEGEMVNFIAFHKLLRADPASRKWVEALVIFLSRIEHTTERQKLLQYGIVVHSMIDTLDPDRLVTRDRPSWSNKLSFKSWKDLKYRVFGVYLNKVPNRQKYLGPLKRTALNKRG